jgi:hypothetical protein
VCPSGVETSFLNSLHLIPVIRDKYHFCLVFFADRFQDGQRPASN